MERYLDGMDADDLVIISGVFEDIYGKWTDDKMWHFLEKLSQKIMDAGYQP